MKRSFWLVPAILLSGWMVASVTSQSTQVAPFVREVNSSFLYGLLDTQGADLSAMAEDIAAIRANLNPDVVHDNAASTSGPQIMGECDDTATDGVDEGDAGRVRVDCTDRAVLVRNIGGSGFKRTSAGTTEDEHEVKATAGVLYSIITTNTNAAARYLRCANLTAANTTPGTSTPIIDLAIPGATTGAGFTVNLNQGLAFSTALTCWLVTGAADTDVAEVAANEIKVLYTFK